MDMQDQKCVMILNENLPLGVMTNTAGIMGITLGKHIPQAVGPDVMDQSGNTHLGIIKIPVPILKAAQDKLKEIRRQLYQPDFADLIVVDFSDVAQSCNDYDHFIEKAASVEESQLLYYGIGICGSKKLVNKLTGNLPLLR